MELQTGRNFDWLIKILKRSIQVTAVPCWLIHADDVYLDICEERVLLLAPRHNGLDFGNIRQVRGRG